MTRHDCGYPDCSEPGTVLWADGFVTCRLCAADRRAFINEIRRESEENRRRREARKQQGAPK